jgi:hypothetical protein
MKMSAYNSRKIAEEGVFLNLCDMYTGEPIEDESGDPDKRPGFIVQGHASPSLQRRLAQLAVELEDESDSEVRMERLHRQQVDSAMKYIVSAVNMQDEDGKDIGDDVEGIRSILDMTFPEMGVVKGKDGKPVTRQVEVKNEEDGTTTKLDVPTFEQSNRTFALQVIEGAREGERFLARPAKR